MTHENIFLKNFFFYQGLSLSFEILLPPVMVELYTRLITAISFGVIETFDLLWRQATDKEMRF